MLLLVPFEKVKNIFPCARVLPDGRAILELARIKQLHGVQPIEVVTAHEVDMLIAEAEGTALAAEDSENPENGGDAVVETPSEEQPAEDENVEQTESQDEEEPESESGDEGEDPDEGKNNEEE